MPEIHPSSQIGPEVQLADDVRIGPGCILDGPITVGSGTRLMANVMLQGPLTLGSDNLVYPFACIGYAPQHKAYPPDQPGAGLVIGNDNTFREHCTIHRAIKDDPTRIGNGNLVMNAGHVGHDCIVGNDCIISALAGIAGHVELQDQAIVGPSGGVQQFTRIGRLAFVGGTIGVNLDLPPFCIAHFRNHVSSLNVVGLRRAGLRDHIEPLKQAFNILYRDGHTNATAITLIENQLAEDPLCQELARFIRDTPRGILPYQRKRTALEA